jgi:hypothetical protein
MSILFQKAELSHKSLNLANFNRMVDYIGRLANMTSPNMMIDRNPNGYVLKVLPSTSSTMSYSDWAFGFSIDGAVVTVNAGKVRHGVRTPITVAGGDITIGADQTWVFVAYTYGSGAATITSSTSEPVDTEEVHNHALYLVTLTSGVASVAVGNIRHLGDIWLPGNFA